MAFPLNSTTAPLSHSAAALLHPGTVVQAFARPVQVHKRIDRRLSLPDPVLTASSLGPRQKPEERLVTACRAEDKAEVGRLLRADPHLTAHPIYKDLLLEAAVKEDDNMVDHLLSFKKSAGAGYIECLDRVFKTVIQMGQLGSFRMLLQKEDLVQLHARTGVTALHVAAMQNYRCLIRELVQAGFNINAKGTAGVDTPLIFAIQCSHAQTVDCFLKLGADPNQKSVHTGLSPLTVASHVGDADKLNLLIRHGAHVDGWGSFASDPLCLAALHGHKACVQALLDAGSTIVIGRQYGFNALNHAAQEGHTEILQRLLDQGVSANARSSPTGGTPLFAAALNEQFACMQILLDGGANINQPCRDGHTILYCCAREGQLASLQWLLAHGVKKQGWKSYKEDPLCIAARNGHIDCVRELIRAGAPIISAREYGFSALHLAALEGHFEIVKYLLDIGVCVNAESSSSGCIALFGAAVSGQLSCMRILLQAGARVNHTDNKGRTALFHASHEGDARAVALLLEHGAKVNGWSSCDNDPLCFAALHGHKACTEKLLCAGARIVTGREYGFSALNNAAQTGQAEILKSLLDHGVSVNAESSPTGGTALLIAVAKGQLACLRILLQAGADVNRPDQSDYTALLYAAAYDQPQALALLLEHGAEVKGWGSYKTDPLYKAASKGHLTCVEILLAAGAPIVSGSQYGFSALNGAVQNGHAGIVELLAQNADVVNAESTPDGGTPLMTAAREGTVVCMEILLQAGADPHRVDHNGHTALEHAVRHGHMEAVELLLSHNKKQLG